jgi:hypothetical protein
VRPMGPVAIARRAQLSSPLPQPGDVRLEIVKREMHVPDSAASNVCQIRQIRRHRIGPGGQDLIVGIVVTGD